MLTTESLSRVQAAIRDAGIDGWLLYDFRGTNAIASGMINLDGMVTRRVFAWIPAAGEPVAITHAIEQGPWKAWPAQWKREIYSSWRTLESLVAGLVRGRVIAMEYSAGDAVPYLDRVPAGVIELVRTAGAKTIVSSADLVTRFYAAWSEADLASHQRAAAAVASVGHDALVRAGAMANAGTPLTEYELQRWILDRFGAEGLGADHAPIVAAGSNAANPHYSPDHDHSSRIERGSILLVDLFAREQDGVYADQTWMGVLGTPTPRAIAVWETIRDARDAAIALIRDRLAAGTPIRGGEADDAARDVVKARGFGDYFTHRTGHSIDPRELHGAGPHLDNLETREDRVLLPGVGFSIEPGVYIPGDIGMRTEVNACVVGRELIVTPSDPQRDLLIV